MFIARAFCVRTVCVFLLILGLAGCVSAGRDTAFNSAAEEGLVIVSIIERQNTGLVWFGGRATFARYDPQTLDITGSTGLRSEIITQGSPSQTACWARRNASAPTSCRRATMPCWR